MMKMLWLGFPFCTFWAGWYVFYNYVPSNPGDTWWAFPLGITIIAMWAISFFFGIRAAAK